MLDRKSPRPVLVVGALPPPAGGIVSHILDVVGALRGAGVVARVVDPRRRGPDGRDGRPRLLAALARAAVTGEIVHVHTNGHNRGSWMVAALGACGAAAGDRGVLTLHSGLAPAFIRAHPRATGSIARRYRAIIAVNHEIRDALVGAAGVPPARIVVWPAFAPSSTAFRLAPPGLAAIRRRTPRLVAAMIAPGPEYGADVLYEAFARLRARRGDVALVVYGPGARDPARAVPDGVLRLGPLGRAQALAVVAACDLFVRPTRADGDAVSVREALALGRAVVASDAAPRPAGVLTFPVGDAAACAEAMFRALGTAGEWTPRAHTVDCLPHLLDLYERISV
jgi:glycosyltransferase involved in cell wall biosynthesis